MSFLFTLCTKSKLSRKNTLPNGDWEWVYSTEYYYRDTLLKVNSTSDRYLLEIKDFLNYKFYKNGKAIEKGSFGRLSSYSKYDFSPQNQDVIWTMTYKDSLLYVSGGFPYPNILFTNVFKLK